MQKLPSDKQQIVAIGIGLQTQVLKACPVHNHIYCDDEADPGSAFALAIELVRGQLPYVEDFHDDAHALTDLLSETLGMAPGICPECQNAAAH